MRLINAAKYEYDETATSAPSIRRNCVKNLHQSNTDADKFTPILGNDKNQLIYSKYYVNIYYKIPMNHKINSMF